MTTVETKKKKEEEEEEEKVLLLILGRVSDLNKLLTLTLLDYKTGTHLITLLTLIFASINS